MQEVDALSSKFPVVQLATPPKGTVEGVDNTSTDVIDSPPVSSTIEQQNKKREDVNDEVIANTNSNITVDSNTVAEALVSVSRD